MRLWRLNPEVIELPNPARPPGSGRSAIAVDCPCGCTTRYVLPEVAGVATPELGTTLTEQQWRQLLNGYSLSEAYRVRNTQVNPCGWDGRIIAGRVFDRDSSSEDDAPFGSRVQETLERLATRRGARGR